MLVEGHLADVRLSADLLDRYPLDAVFEKEVLCGIYQLFTFHTIITIDYDIRINIRKT